MHRRLPHRIMRKLQERERRRQIATERVKMLSAAINGTNEEELQRRYVKTVIKMCRIYKVEIPKFLCNRICRSCFRYLVPGRSCKVRIRKGRRVIYCECGAAAGAAYVRQ